MTLEIVNFSPRQNVKKTTGDHFEGVANLEVHAMLRNVRTAITEMTTSRETLRRSISRLIATIDCKWALVEDIVDERERDRCRARRDAIRSALLNADDELTITWEKFRVIVDPAVGWERGLAKPG